MSGYNKQKLREVLSHHFQSVLIKEIDNQATRVDSISKWERIYKGFRKEKSFPWIKCSNVAIPMARTRTDAIHVRIIAAIWDRTRVWLFKALREELKGIDREIEDAMEWWQKNILKFKQKMLSPILQCVKTGTGVIKMDWVERHRTVYRYATDKETSDKNTTTYKLAGTTRRAVKYVETEYVGPDIFPIDRKHFIISSDADSIEDAYIVGFKFPLRKQELELRTLQKDNEGNPLYYKDAVKRMNAPVEIDEGKESKAEMQRKQIDYVEDVKPYWPWELWCRFDVDEDGEEDDIVLTIDKDSGEILRCIYNPLYKKFRPFIDFVFYPHEYSFDGEGVVEVLEKVNIEVDGLHNMRNDRMTLINAPETLVKAGIGLDGYKRSPGKVTEVHTEIDETVFRELAVSDTTFSTYAEEDTLNAYADRAVGTPPVAMGFAESERPVAKETFARQHEMQRKFNYGIQNVMFRVVNVGYMGMEFFAQYQPEYSYRTDVEGVLQERTVDFPLDYIRDGFQIEIEGATRLTSQEERRDSAITKYKLLQDYYTSVAGMLQALGLPETPMILKQFILRVLENGDKAFIDILKDFNMIDAEDFAVNAEEWLNPEQVMTQQMPQQPPQGQPPQGQPMGGMRVG